MENRHEPFDQMTFHTTPNYLTLLRVLFVPAVIVSLYQGTPLWDFLGAVFFGLAGITDYFDGYLARKHKIETVYGKLLDPLADKFLVICSFIMLQHLGRMSPIVVMLLVCRELTITGLRALASGKVEDSDSDVGHSLPHARPRTRIPLPHHRDVADLPLARAVALECKGLHCRVFQGTQAGHRAQETKTPGKARSQAEKKRSEKKPQSFLIKPSAEATSIQGVPRPGSSRAPSRRGSH
jgi:phosphatidylglycerophosphate synthase